MHYRTIEHQYGFSVLVPVMMLLTAIAMLVISSSLTVRHLLYSNQIRIQAHQARETASIKLDNIASRLLTNENISEITAATGAVINQHQVTTASGSVLDAFDIQLTYSVGNPTPRFLSQQLLRYPLLLRRPRAALVAATALPAPTTLAVYSDEHHVWSPFAGTVSLRQQRCHSEQLIICSPLDILADAQFPTDIGLWLFNRQLSELSVTDFPEAVQKGSCHGLSSESVRVIWVNGHCTVGPGQRIGTQSDPVLLFVSHGDLDVPAGSVINGLVIMLSTGSGFDYKITMATDARIVGALIAANGIDPLSTMKLVYSNAVLLSLQNSNDLSRMQTIPGSWHDFR